AAAALEGPLLELLKALFDFVGFAFLGDPPNLPWPRQLHELSELVPIPHQAPEDGELREDHIDRLHAQGPAIPDDDQGPALVKHLHPVRKGQVVPYEVDHDIGATIPGDVHDL